MTRKPKIDLSRPELAKTLAERVAFSAAVREAEEAAALSRRPVDVFDLWFDLEKYPWASATFSETWANAEREKARLRRRFLREQK
jgi:hypothetical protein